MADVKLKLLLLKCQCGKLTVVRRKDIFACPVEIPEKEVDYLLDLCVGCENTFFIPEALARRVGLLAEKE